MTVHNARPEPRAPLPPDKLDSDVLVQVAERQAIDAEPLSIDLKARRWVLRVIAMLLMLQALVLLTTSVIYVTRLDWPRELNNVMLSARALDTFLSVGLLAPLGVIELATASSMWRGRISAWLQAMIVQGVLLIFCLSSYIAGQIDQYIYLLMLTCIMIVLYLNANDVRLAFNSRQPNTRRRRRRA